MGVEIEENSNSSSFSPITLRGILYIEVNKQRNTMAELPKGRKWKRPRNKVAFKEDGTPDKAKTTPFYSENTSHHSLYETQRWRRLTKRMLRENPICPVCMTAGDLTPASETDHIVAHKGDTSLFYNTENLWCLCKQCHARKTAAERNGKDLTTKEGWLEYLTSIRR